MFIAENNPSSNFQLDINRLTEYDSPSFLEVTIELCHNP